MTDGLSSGKLKIFKSFSVKFHCVSDHILSLSESTTMEGNDFIIFKHGCGDDSTYHDPSNPLSFSVDEETRERFETPCENVTFYHVEVEYGGASYTYNSVSEEENNPIIFKIRNATLLEWDLTISGKEEIWFDMPPEIDLHSKQNTRKRKNNMRLIFGVFKFLFNYLSNYAVTVTVICFAKMIFCIHLLKNHGHR